MVYSGFMNFLISSLNSLFYYSFAMDSYIKLISNISNPDFQRVCSVETKNTNLKKLFGNHGLLNLLVYIYDIQTNEFNLNSSDFGYQNFTNTNLKVFFNSIKPCFRNYFIEYFASYIQFLTENINKNSNSEYSLQSFLPIKLKKDEYYFVTLYIIPEVVDYKIVELYFILLPLKVYNNEIIIVNVLKDFKNDYCNTCRVRNRIQLEDILTEEQTKIANLIWNGYSSKKIADKLNKKHNNILKYNIRIKDRLSDFFNVKFDNAKEAIYYCKSCFFMNNPLKSIVKSSDIPNDFNCFH